ncbi:MAG: Ig-like domain-containing protein [Phycisphaerae bacterium]|jgi:hypothetical protein
MDLELSYNTLPEYPNGANGWYISPTEISLYPNSGSDITIYWNWNTSGSYYSSGDIPAGVPYNIGYLPSGANVLYCHALSDNYDLVMDGTTLNKDLVHDVAATTTGTPSSGSLLGVEAPYISSGGFTRFSYPNSSIGLVAGEPITCIFAVNTTWAGNDGVTHFLFNTNYSGDHNGIRIVKFSSNYLSVQVYSDDSIKQTSIAVNGTNWAAGVDHIIIITIDEDNNQRIFLDGIEPTPVHSGSSGRELVMGSWVDIGTSWGYTQRTEGYILCALYNRILSDTEIEDLSGMTEWFPGYQKTENYSFVFRYDDVSPTFTLTEPSGTTWSGSITVSASGSDELSGVAHTDIFVDGWLTYTEILGELEYILDTTRFKDGTHSLDVSVYDRAGHITASGMSGIIDNSPPVINYTDFSLISDSSYNVSGTSYDVCSNVEKVEFIYYSSSSGSGTWQEVTYTSGENTSFAYWYAPLTGLVNEDWVLQFRAEDTLGNITPSGTYPMKVFTVEVDE